MIKILFIDHLPTENGAHLQYTDWVHVTYLLQSTLQKLYFEINISLITHTELPYSSTH